MLIKPSYVLSGDSLFFWTWVALKFNQGFIGAWSDDGRINKIAEGYITSQGHTQSNVSPAVYWRAGATQLIKKMI